MRRTLLFFVVLYSVYSSRTNAQSLEFIPEGQLNVVIDTRASLYLNIGGPTLFLLNHPTSKIGINLVPSLRFRENSGKLKVATSNGAGIFYQQSHSGIKFSTIMFYDGPDEPWKFAFGIGKVFKRSSRP